MIKEQSYLSTGTVYIPLAKIREVYGDFLEMRNHFPSCNILFTSRGIKDVNMIALQYCSYSPEEFQFAHENFFSRYHSYTPCAELKTDNFYFSARTHVRFDTLLQLRKAMVNLRKSGWFKQCVIFYTVSGDLSHAHIHFYTHNNDTLIEFLNLMSSEFSEYLYTER
ncbi:MAG: hypothetical protein HFJ58_06190 [Clostridia bacterium]|nr:hypothetical protein [Clostridia bacterium]